MSEYEDMSRKDLVIENMKFHTDITSLTKQRDALLAACEYNQRLLTENTGQTTHAIALNKAAIKLCKIGE